MDTKLVRPRKDRVIAGVCQGLADYFNIDVVIVRVIFVVLALGKGMGILAYIVLLIVMPEEGVEAKEKTGSDAHQSNIGNNLRSSAAKMQKSIKADSRGTELVAIILIVFGVIFLLSNLAPAFFSFDRVWPLLLVVLGISILVSGRKKDK